MEHTLSVDHTFDIHLDPKHLSAITNALKAVLRSRRRLLALKDNTTLLSDERYFEYECSLNELRRCIAFAGCSNLRRRRFSTVKETIAYAAMQTLAREKEVREPRPDSLVASAP